MIISRSRAGNVQDEPNIALGLKRLSVQRMKGMWKKSKQKQPKVAPTS